jgi:hypothetical protein
MSTNLVNTLQSINRERERISENAQAVELFKACKLLRRRICRYVCFCRYRCPKMMNIDANRSFL